MSLPIYGRQMTCSADTIPDHYQNFINQSGNLKLGFMFPFGFWGEWKYKLCEVLQFICNNTVDSKKVEWNA